MTRRRQGTFVLALTTLLVSCTGHSGTTPSAGPIALPTTPDALPLVDVASFNQLLTGLRGHPVVVNVWAGWCGPCQDEAPMLRKAAIDHPNVQFVGVDALDSKSDAIGFIRRNAIPYPSVFDPGGAVGISLELPGQPGTVFYDANGHVQATSLGVLNQQSLDAGIVKITS